MNEDKPVLSEMEL